MSQPQAPPLEDHEVQALERKKRRRAMIGTAITVAAVVLYGWLHPPVEEPWRQQRKDILLQLWLETDSQRDASVLVVQESRDYLLRIQKHRDVYTRDDERQAQFTLDTAESKLRSLEQQLTTLSQDMSAVGFGKRRAKHPQPQPTKEQHINESTAR